MNSQLRTFFATSVTHQRVSHFHRTRMAELLIETLLHYRDQRVYRLHDFVVMPDHFHVILTPSEKLSLERVMQRIKGGFSFRAGKEINPLSAIWQRSFTHHLILNPEDMEHHHEYVIQNPVRAGLAATPQDYPWSSAQRRFRMDSVDEIYLNILAGQTFRRREGSNRG